MASKTVTRSIAIDLTEFRRIPKEGHITDFMSKAESTVGPAMLRYSTTQFVIHFTLLHFITT